MTDGPQQCALPECNEFVEQPDDGGPRRLYCSPAHRAAARKMRHAARMDSTATQPTSIGSGVTQPISGPQAEQQDESTATEPPAALAAPRPEPDPGQAPEHEWSPAAAWTITPPALPPAPKERAVRTITSKRVKKQRPVRTAADLKNAASAMRRRAVASVAIASLVAGGASYMVTENIIPTPTTLPPQAAPQPSMEADVWAGQAEVVLASLSSQLDAVAQAEAAWLGLPVDRRAQEPDAVQALKDRKALLEQQRATLMSQLEALRALPDRTTELTSAQAQLDAVERTLNESTSTAASPDYQEALRQLEEQREMRRQQRDHAAQALADLRSGVEEALSAPLPAEKDKNDTTKVVERVKAVVEGRPDPGDQDDDPEHDAGDGQEPASNQRREDEGEERDDTGTTAPPDPERPSVPDVLAGGVGEPGSDGGGTSPDPGSGNSNGDTDNAPTDPASADNASTDNAPTDNSSADNSPADEPEGPVSPIANPLGGLLGGNDSDRSESDERSAREDDNDDDDRGNSWAGRDDDDDNEHRDNSWFDRGDDDDDRGNSWLGGNDDNDDNEDRGNSWLGGDDDVADEGDSDRGRLDDLTDGMIGDDRGDDTDERGNANGDDRDEGDDRAAEDNDRGGLDDVTDGLIGDDRNEGAEDRNAESDDGGDDDAEQAGDEDRAGGDEERKRPVGKAERERQRAEENNESASEASDQDEGDEKSPSDDRGDEDRGENADDNNDRGAGDDDNNEDAGEDDDKGDNADDKGDNKGYDKGDDKGDDTDGDDGGSDSGDDGDGGDGDDGGSDSGGDD